jgi:acetate kinase
LTKASSWYFITVDEKFISKPEVSMPKQLVLVLNCGSSSVKFAVIDHQTGKNEFNGLVQCIGAKDANVKFSYDGKKEAKILPNIDYRSSLQFVIEYIKKDPNLFDNIVAVGHRVVHGGESFTRSVVIDNGVIDAIRACSELAPLHNPANIIGIEEAGKAFPNLSQVAVFDTAFHQTIPEFAYLYPIPYQFYLDYKIRRYGFHGTSHRFVAGEAATKLKKPLEQCSLITAHLGNGCSCAAISYGKSVDTSMGLTPLEGLMMGTRCGDIDPSLHSYLADSLGYDVHKVTEILNKKSGLLGISQLDSDLRTIENAIAQGNHFAKLAVDIFCYRLAKYLAGYTVALDHLDALVFTGGIGENSSLVREKTIGLLKLFGFELDLEQNQNHGKNNNGIITKTGSTLAMVIPTNEELLIARDAYSLVKQ